MPVPVPRPSGQSEAGALPILFVGSLAAGALAGVALGVVSRWFSLFILFPLLLGAAVGAFASWRVSLGKIRAPLAAGLVAFLGGAAGQVTVHRVDYEAFRRDATKEILAEAPDADPDAEIEAFLVERTGRGGWPGFIALAAENGISLKRGGSSTQFRGTGAYVLWLLEILLAGGVGAWMAGDRARQPFCEHCKQWYDGVEVVAVGSADKAAWKALVAKLERGDAALALSARGAPTEKAASLVELATCTRCDAHQPVLTVFTVDRPGTGKEKKTKRHRTALRFEEAQALRKAAEGEKTAHG